MLHDVEDILCSWEATGLLQDCHDRFNLALCLETQRRVNERQTHPMNTQFNRVSIPTILHVCKQSPDLFQGLIDVTECNDVYRLGLLPRSDDDAVVCGTLVARILQLNLEPMYFGGLAYQDGRVYLLTDPIQ